MLANEARAPQEPQVFRDRGPGNGERPGDVPGRKAARAKKVEHRPPRGIGQGPERRRFVICSLTVTHNA
jgi:hypothetical protein